MGDDSDWPINRRSFLAGALSATAGLSTPYTLTVVDDELTPTITSSEPTATPAKQNDGCPHYPHSPRGEAPNPPDIITDWNKTVLVESPQRWAGRTSIVTLESGTWILAYREASRHPTNDGQIYLRFSDDEGRSWSADNTYLNGDPISFTGCPPEAGPDSDVGPGEPWLYCTPNGDLILHCWKVNYATRNHGTWQSRSTDGGQTWSEWQQVSFPDYTDDSVFATDDHFTVNGTIYAGARIGSTAADLEKNVLIKSTDNAHSWQVVSEVTTYDENTSEIGIEYLGNGEIVVVANNPDRKHTYYVRSSDMGESWTRPVKIEKQTGVWDRPRLYSRRHLAAQSNTSTNSGWWEGDDILLGIGSWYQEPPQMSRVNALWISRDSGTSWDGPYPLDTRDEKDGGYGDIKQRSDGSYVVISYQGCIEEASVRQYEFSLDLSKLSD